ncbi:MAG: hypothetical protein EBS75_10485 [Betaproteobacteria bacterium]|nr:hypothetical protein [Betaproteobacteria bacterium]
MGLADNMFLSDESNAWWRAQSASIGNRLGRTHWIVRQKDSMDLHLFRTPRHRRFSNGSSVRSAIAVLHSFVS